MEGGGGGGVLICIKSRCEQGYFGQFPQESLSLGGYPAEQINIRFRSELIIRFKIR